MPGTLFVVATPIGNLEDVTARALRVLREVALIAAEDTRRTAQLLARYAIVTPKTSYHAHNEKTKGAMILARLQSGDAVALVSDAGTPTLSDPGQHLIRLAIDAGIRVEPVPGPSAVMAALSASGLAVGAFTFLGFPPTRAKDRKQWFGRLRSAGHTVVFFEAPHRIRATLQQILDTVGDRQIAVGREMSKIHEEFLRGPISFVLSHIDRPRGEFTAVIDIGHMTSIDGPESLGNKPAVLSLPDEFGYLTETMRLSRREAIRRLATTRGMSRNEVYDAIEGAKNSVE